MKSPHVLAPPRPQILQDIVSTPECINASFERSGFSGTATNHQRGAACLVAWGPAAQSALFKTKVKPAESCTALQPLWYSVVWPSWPDFIWKLHVSDVLLCICFLYFYPSLFVIVLLLCSDQPQGPRIQINLKLRSHLRLCTIHFK